LEFHRLDRPQVRPLISIAYPPGVRTLGLIINHEPMAWRPYENLIDGELDNRVPGQVKGSLRFFRSGSRPLVVKLDLVGDFHEDIRGKLIRLRNPNPMDRDAEFDRGGTYMKGFSAMQRGEVGDITAGLPLGPWTEEIARKLMAQNELIWQQHGLPEPERDERRQDYARCYREHIASGDLYYAYVPYPYLEWYSDANGRVVLELERSQVDVLEAGVPKPRDKTAAELHETERKRVEAFGKFMAGMAKQLSRENRKHGGDGTVFGAVI